MGRGGNRTKNGLSLLISVGLLVLFGMACFFLFARSGESFRNQEKLDVVSYVESAKPFQGGKYWCEGTVMDVFTSSQSKGRLISFSVAGPKNNLLIPILVPATAHGINLQKGQRLRMGLKASERGLLVVEKMEKT